jgi:hypothetical protein
LTFLFYIEIDEFLNIHDTKQKIYKNMGTSISIVGWLLAIVYLLVGILASWWVKGEKDKSEKRAYLVFALVFFATAIYCAVSAYIIF